MDMSTLIIAVWFYLGRALLLPLAGLSPYPGGAKTITSFTLGLIIPPAVIAIVSLASGPFLVVVLVLLLIDLLLLAAIIKRRPFDLPRLTTRRYLIAAFVLFCGMLAWLNGPYVEQLTDAWWHMRRVSWLINHQLLILPEELSRHHLPWIDWIGIGSGSYRMQAIVAWLSGSTMPETWPYPPWLSPFFWRFQWCF